MIGTVKVCGTVEIEVAERLLQRSIVEHRRDVDEPPVACALLLLNRVGEHPPVGDAVGVYVRPLLTHRIAAWEQQS